MEFGLSIWRWQFGNIHLQTLSAKFQTLLDRHLFKRSSKSVMYLAMHPIQLKLSKADRLYLNKENNYRIRDSLICVVILWRG
jgi:hypothetical protein